MSARSAVVVVNYGSHDLLEQNLAATIAGTGVAVVVVDSFSTEDERAQVDRLATDRGWTAVLADRNTGFGGGVNLGVARAIELGATTLVVLNPDARMEPVALVALALAAERAPDRLVAPVIHRPDGSVWSHGITYVSLDDGIMRSAAKPPRSERERGWLSGACFALSAQLWGKTGGFDEEYFLYWEDVDFSAKVEAAGGVLEVLPQVFAVHDEGATHHDSATGTRAKSGTYYYHNIRGRLMYAAKQLGADDQRRWRRTRWQAARAIILQGGRKQLLRSATPWTAARRGTRDGMRYLRDHGSRR